MFSIPLFSVSPVHCNPPHSPGVPVSSKPARRHTRRLSILSIVVLLGVPAQAAAHTYPSGNPYVGLEPWSWEFVVSWLSVYIWSFAALGIVVAIAIARKARSKRSRRFDELPNNLWPLSVYAWALQSALLLLIGVHGGALEDWAHPLFYFNHSGALSELAYGGRAGLVLLPMFGMLGVLLTLQTLAVLLLDRELAPDGLGGRVGWGAKVAAIAVILDAFFYLVLVTPTPSTASW